MTTILHVNASARVNGSASRTLSGAVVEQLRTKHTNAKVIKREVGERTEFPDEEWVIANFTAADARSAEQARRMAFSQELVEELSAADFVVIGCPIYNFGVSGALKAWIDQICRPGLTFRAEPNGFVGLLGKQKVYLVVTSGGTKVNGPIDFATGYMMHILAFLGITDVHVIAADTMMADPDGAIDRGMKQIDELLSREGK